MVRLAAGRHDQVRREPAEEVRGHRQRRLLRATRSRRLWYALRDIVLFWVEQGVKIFRVDNPHTKPFPFWEWMIGEVQARAPGRDLPRRGVHAAEGDEAPGQGRLHPVLHLLHLAQHQGGADRVPDRADARPSAATYMRPNFFVNTPDINPYFLQTSGRPGFRIARSCSPRRSAATTASTAASSCARRRRCPGKEEYLDSEKYEIKAWDWDRPGNITRRHPPDQPAPPRATRRCRTSRTSPSTTPGTTTSSTTARRRRTGTTSCCSPSTSTRTTAQDAHFEVPLWEFGLPDEASIEVEDLVTGSRFTWHGKVQHMLARPAASGPTRSGASTRREAR